MRGVPYGHPSDVPQLRTIEHNFLVNDHNANWPLGILDEGILSSSLPILGYIGNPY
jgi:hypothetical protein